MISSTLPLRFKCLALGLALLVLPPLSHGQSYATAHRSSDFSLFAAGSISQTDYNSLDQGVTVGGDFTQHFHYINTSLDVRYNNVTGQAVNERSFGGGLKLSLQYGRYHPYVHSLLGYGIVTFNHPATNTNGTLYTHDDSSIYNAGGGVDIDLNRRFSVKIDGQYQFWNLGSHDNAGSVKLNPTIASFGIVYHLPYRSLRPRSY